MRGAFGAGFTRFRIILLLAIKRLEISLSARMPEIWGDGAEFSVFGGFRRSNQPIRPFSIRKAIRRFFGVRNAHTLWVRPACDSEVFSDVLTAVFDRRFSLS